MTEKGRSSLKSHTNLKALSLVSLQRVTRMSFKDRQAMLWWLKHHTKKKRPAISANNTFANGKGVSLDAIN